MMTKEEMTQDLFNKMWRGLSAQNWIPAYKNETCYYRMDDGRKCAVGHCIPDDMYSGVMEGFPVDHLRVLDDLGWSKWPEVMDFLQDAQDEHDSTPNDLRETFERLAAKYGLTIPDVEVAE